MFDTGTAVGQGGTCPGRGPALGGPRLSAGERRVRTSKRFDQVNERLAGQGMRTISLADSEHVERYGLEELARSRGVVEPD